jgi:UDP-N-acetylmuramyl pentapeptide phosphotransferase/UDP-N-acetylglucosamine-1-phosphate transferase
MERNEMFYYVIILFALLIAVLLLVDFMMKRALAKGKSEESEGEKPSRVTKFMKGVDFFLALPLATIAVNHFQVSVYTLVALALGFVLGVYTLYLCLTLRQKQLTLRVIVKMVVLVLIYVVYK